MGEKGQKGPQKRSPGQTQKHPAQGGRHRQPEVRRPGQGQQAFAHGGRAGEEQAAADGQGRKLPYPQPKDWGYGGL